MSKSGREKLLERFVMAKNIFVLNPRIHPCAKIVFLVLLTHRWSDERHVFPHVKTIAIDYLGLNPKTVSKYIKILEDLSLVAKWREGERRRGNTYALFNDFSLDQEVVGLNPSLAKGFVKVPNTLLLNPFVSWDVKLIFIVISAHIHKRKGQVPRPWAISQSEIARKAGFGRHTSDKSGVDTVCRALPLLVKYRLIEIRKRPTQEHFCYEYHYCDPEEWELPSCAEEMKIKRERRPKKPTGSNQRAVGRCNLPAVNYPTNSLDKSPKFPISPHSIGVNFPIEKVHDTGAYIDKKECHNKDTEQQIPLSRGHTRVRVVDAQALEASRLSHAPFLDDMTPPYDRNPGLNVDIVPTPSPRLPNERVYGLDGRSLALGERSEINAAISRLRYEIDDWKRRQALIQITESLKPTRPLLAAKIFRALVDEGAALFIMSMLLDLGWTKDQVLALHKAEATMDNSLSPEEALVEEPDYEIDSFQPYECPEEEFHSEIDTLGGPTDMAIEWGYLESDSIPPFECTEDVWSDR